MPKKLYVVDLTPEERTELLGSLNRGSAPARRLTRARHSSMPMKAVRTRQSRKHCTSAGQRSSVGASASLMEGWSGR